MKTDKLQADLCVVGGGLAGVCAAVAAARGGLRTVLVHDRPVLGGNASSEIRVWIQGATASGNNTFAREGGILNEILLEHLHRNPECNPHLFDALLLDRVTREQNLTLLLDTAALECTMAPRTEQAPQSPDRTQSPHQTRSADPSQAPDLRSGDARIASIAAFNAFNQTRYEIAAHLFADTSGDGIVGFLAGAEFRMGREATGEYGEPWAPPKADNLTLGDSMYFLSRRADRPVRFVAPSFAIDITRAGIPPVRIERLARTAEPYGCELWWCEYGGLLHTVYDAESIKSHLTGLIYGIWDYVKNSGRIGDTETLTLEWVGSMPGRRESRRFLGDHVLTQPDVVEQRAFPDGIGAAGWSIDLHPSGGVYSPDAPSMHLHVDWVYNVPFRCLYSRNVRNLLLAGRLISATHVAFGSIRVMGTAGMTGQAIGTAAVQCVRRRISPRELATSPPELETLRQRLLRDGQHIVGACNTDPADLARQAAVTASSVAVLDERTGDEIGVRAVKGLRLMVPLADPRTEWLELLAAADEPTDLEYELACNDKVVNYRPNKVLARGTLALSPGRQWVRIALPPLEAPQNVWLTFSANERVELRCQRAMTAGALFEDLSIRAGYYARYRGTPCLRLARPQRLYEPPNVIEGHHRPEVFPHAWVSGPLAAGPQWIELALPRPAQIGLVQVTFNGDVNQLIWTQLYASDRRAMAQIVRDCDVELFDQAGRVARRLELRDNHQQLVRLDAGRVEAQRVRITCLAGWGHDRAEIHEVRLYPPGA